MRAGAGGDLVPYPLVEGTEEETIFNMVNAMLFRIHQSGYLGQIGEQRMQYVREGIACYKKIREDIRRNSPAGRPVLPPCLTNT